MIICVIGCQGSILKKPKKMRTSSRMMMNTRA